MLMQIMQPVIVIVTKQEHLSAAGLRHSGRQHQDPKLIEHSHLMHQGVLTKLNRGPIG